MPIYERCALQIPCSAGNIAFSLISVGISISKMIKVCISTSQRSCLGCRLPPNQRISTGFLPCFRILRMAFLLLLKKSTFISSLNQPTLSYKAYLAGSGVGCPHCEVLNSFPKSVDTHTHRMRHAFRTLHIFCFKMCFFGDKLDCISG